MTPEYATAVAQVATQAIKLAEAAKAKSAKGGLPADPTLVEKAASALIDTGFVETTLRKEAAAKIATHAGALELIHDLAVKAGEEIARLSGTGNPRLAAGSPTADPTKAAGCQGTSEADAKFYEAMNKYRTQ